MLAIRMQRTGRSGHAQFRLIVQDSHRSPKSGNIVAALGSYDPHTKQITMDKEKAAFFLEHGAQPSSRVAILMQKEGIKLPKWVKLEGKKEAAIRNPEKRRSTSPQQPNEEENTTEKPIEEAAAEDTETVEAETQADTDSIASTDTPEETTAEAESAEK